MTNQNDFVIDNGTGLAVRTDIQDALQALAGNSSGNSEPSVKYAYQWWADSNAAVMKLRNSANDGWIELFQLDGTLTLEDGSASTPALAFRDDLNTGIFSSAADTFNVATGGVERMELGAATVFNEDGADVDFRIEGDTEANLFYVDAGNNRIGIGTNSPDVPLTTVFTNNNSSSFTTGAALASGANANLYALHLQNTGTGNSESSLLFSTGDTQFAQWSFNCIKTGAFLGDLAFRTRSGSATSAERMRIDSSGNVGINQVPTRELSLHSPNNNNALIHFTNDDTGETSADGILVGLDGNENMVINNQETGKTINFYNGGSERMRIDSSGNMLLGLTTTSFPKRLNIQGSSGSIIALKNNDTTSYAADTNTSIEFGLNTGSTGNQTGACELRAFKENGTNGNNARGLSFYTGANGGSNIERMRITSAGEIFTGGQTTITSTGHHIGEATTGNSFIRIGHDNTGANYSFMMFRHDGSDIGTIQQNSGGTGVAYNTSSDYRLKENATAISDGITRLKTLKPYRFNFKIDPDNTVDGFFAHEVTAVPEAITGTKDEVDSDNNPVYQGIDQSKIVPLLVAAVQELITKVETLEAA